jgi:filamentous hemagglutinin
MTTLAAQAAVSLINNHGDIGQTLNDLGSSESVKQVVTAMLTAGLVQGVTTAFNLPNPTATNAAFVDRFRTYATQAAVKAGVHSAMYGEPLSETMKAALVSSLAQSLTAEVGDWGVKNNLAPGSLEKMLAHAVVQCAAASVMRQDCGSAALGGAIAEALSPLGDKLDQTDYAKNNKLGGQLGNAIASMTSILVADLMGKDSMTASAAASMVDSFNRQLHQDERQLAKKLAEKSNGQFTEAEVADALRWANNKVRGETASSSMVVDQTLDGTLGNNPTDAVASTVFDPMLPGQGTTASQPYTAGQGANGVVLTQNMGQVARPSEDLMAYIQIGTGDTYSWDTSAWEAPTSSISSDRARYGLFSANGKTYQLPLADCTAAACQGSPIAWASTNPEDQAALKAYAIASGVEMTSFVSRTSGIIGSAATAAAATPGPHQPVAAGTAVVATGVGMAADAVEQAINPDVGKTAQDFLIKLFIEKGVVERFAPTAAPAVNELTELWKQSNSSKSAQDWINEQWGKAVQRYDDGNTK